MEAAELIRRVRTSARLTQAELADRSGVPRTVLSAYERGRRDPGARALAAILAAAGYELSVTRRNPDLAGNARRFADALDLADRLPKRKRGGLTFPTLPRTPPS